MLIEVHAEPGTYYFTISLPCEKGCCMSDFLRFLGIILQNISSQNVSSRFHCSVCDGRLYVCKYGAYELLCDLFSHSLCILVFIARFWLHCYVVSIAVPCRALPSHFSCCCLPQESNRLKWTVMFCLCVLNAKPWSLFTIRSPFMVRGSLVW